MDSDLPDDQSAPPTLSAGESAPQRRRYGSRAMLERRRRILAEARSLIDELGVEGFTIRELSHRAGVAPRTLYNLFGSREDIMASAIHHHFAGLLAQAPPPPPSDDFEATLRRIDHLLDRTIELRSYATAMVDVFFRPTVDRRIYDTLRWISEGGSASWVAQAAAEGLLVHTSESDRTRLATLLVNTGYANITDWAAGRISEEEMKARYKFNFLVCIMPFAGAARRSQIQRLLERVRRGETV
jgi:AcrR family transcriptional regulator